MSTMSERVIDKFAGGRTRSTPPSSPGRKLATTEQPMLGPTPLHPAVQDVVIAYDNTMKDNERLRRELDAVREQMREDVNHWRNEATVARQMVSELQTLVDHQTTRANKAVRLNATMGAHLEGARGSLDDAIRAAVAESQTEQSDTQTETTSNAGEHSVEDQVKEIESQIAEVIASEPTIGSKLGANNRIPEPGEIKPGETRS